MLSFFALLGLVAVAATITLTSCSCDNTGGLFGPRHPVEPTAQGVPTIRVKLTPRPLDATDISSSGGYVMLIDGQPLAQSASAMPTVTIRRVAAGWDVAGHTYPGQMLEFRTAANSCLRLDSTFYRGSFVFVPQGGQFHVVNHVDLETYVAGVLPRELLHTWQGATYHAQAVAARTFARYQSITVGKSNFFDVTDDQASQVYGGQTAETDKSWQAVNETRGVMLAYGSGSQQGIFLPQYSACCGGTVNGAYVIRDAPNIQPLMGGQPCDDCSASPRYRWAPVRVPKSDIYKAVIAAYPAETSNLAGGVTDVRVNAMTTYGRPVWVDVIGQGGKPVRLRADDLRLAMIRSKGSFAANQVASIYSMNCKIRSVGDAIEFYDGKGFGHGVGLCQYGAEGKALKGLSGDKILMYYYPGATLVKAY